MSRKRLSILIPTFNRSRYLRQLLETLEQELRGLEDTVGILVSDNGSTDTTHKVTEEFLGRMPNLRVIRHSQNLGMDENFCGCVEADDSEYFWLMGDDDLPRAGAVGFLLDLIGRETPDIVYVESDWRTELLDNQPNGPLPQVAALELTPMTFARRVNIWATFISGMVVRRATFVEGATSHELRRYNNTNLIQLAWVFGTLQRARKLLYIPEPCVLATSGNTGGYAVLKVFGEYFPSIVNQQFGKGSSMSRAIILRSVLGYLPGLVWKVRTGQVGNFTNEQSSAAIVQREHAGALGFFVVSMISRKYALTAFGTRAICAALTRILRFHDRMLEVFGGVKRNLS